MGGATFRASTFGSLAASRGGFAYGLTTFRSGRVYVCLALILLGLQVGTTLSFYHPCFLRAVLLCVLDLSLTLRPATPARESRLKPFRNSLYRTTGTVSGAIDVIVNVSSTVTLKSIPLISIYSASKHALNGFTQSLALELEPFNIRVKLVLPGRAPETSFAQNVQQMMDEFPPAYTDMAQQLLQSFGDSEGPTTESVDVAEAVWRAATDPSAPTRIPAGADAVIWAREAMMSAATA